MREALRRIEEATGVCQLDEVIAKVQKYSETTSALQDMHKSLESKLMGLYSRRDNLATRVDESSGKRPSGSTQQVFDEQERHFNETEF